MTILMPNEPVIIHEIETNLTPIDCLKLFEERSHLFFLDSGMDSQKLGRYSFLGFDPFLTLRSKAGQIEIIENGRVRAFAGNPFLILKDILKRFKIEGSETHLPFTCGAVGYFGYDLCHHLEKIPSCTVDDMSIPDMHISLYDTSIAFDHLRDKVFVSSSGLPELDPAKRELRALRRMDRIMGMISDAAGATRKERITDGPLEEPHIISNFTKPGYIDAIIKAKEHIAMGDIYQVNLSQRLSCDIAIPPRALFERLRAINPAPFSAFLDLGDLKIVSASPERFLCKRGANIHTRPIKGTRPRGIDPADDERMKIELISSAKDRAEHVMIVDLERNDLGRICQHGSVLPTEFIALETYATVFHLTSTVGGILRQDVDAVDCLMNCFPGGSITGAPKIRSMEIIDALEPTRRSVYTGSIGYIGFDGDMDTSIVIRTFIIKGKKAYFQVGGGIVADSDPEMEYEETLHKARALVDALGPCHSGRAVCHPERRS
ncbi:MAG: aminodeoxychorismate synthase component I, partial [Candidatus Omnitrophota bacterium]